MLESNVEATSKLTPKSKIHIDHEAEMERKLKERLAVYEKVKLMEIKIDSKSLMASATTSRQVTMSQRQLRKSISSVNSASTTSIKPVKAKKIEKRKKNKISRVATQQAKQRPSISTKHRMSTSGNDQIGSRRLSQIGTRRFQEGSRIRRPSDLQKVSIPKQDIKLVEGRILLPRSNSPIEKLESIQYIRKESQDERQTITQLKAQQCLETREDSDFLDLQESQVSELISHSVQIPSKMHLEKPKSPIQFNQTINQEDNIKDKEGKKQLFTEIYKKDTRVLLNEAEKSSIKENEQNQQVISVVSNVTEKDAKLYERKKSLKLQQDILKEERKKQEAIDYKLKIQKTGVLFDFIRGKSGPPVRVGSASYCLPMDFTENKPTINQHQKVDQEDLKSFSEESEFASNRFFMSWLDNYELKKMKSQERMTRVKSYQNKMVYFILYIKSQSVFFLQLILFLSYGREKTLIHRVIKLLI